ncbi:hypothetical protein PV396_29065 [Streptomyces sp. ME02-8801-2C]|nr:hypothetical protein [Streptomyces sp. ME02-8801-2C]MDX3455945.1 hypothetical protein [Streptomyces sp. ME02-8801-2C]
MTDTRVGPFPAFPAGVTLTASVYGTLTAAPATGTVSAADATTAITRAAA